MRVENIFIFKRIADFEFIFFEIRVSNGSVRVGTV